jgi:hypothetical protein
VGLSRSGVRGLITYQTVCYLQRNDTGESFTTIGDDSRSIINAGVQLVESSGSLCRGSIQLVESISTLLVVSGVGHRLISLLGWSFCNKINMKGVSVGQRD